MLLKYDGASVLYVNENIDEGSDWYVVQPGNVFTKSSIDAGTFPRLVTFGPVGYPAVNVGTGDSYLGVNTGVVGVGTYPWRSVFGWVHLRPSAPGSNMLTMVDNVMSYDSAGIVVGTTTVVPEPSAFAGILVVVLRLLIRRERET